MKIYYANYIAFADNIGDNAQIYALDLIYQKMGIPENEIVRFSKETVSERIHRDCHYILPLVSACSFYYDLIPYLRELNLEQNFSFIPLSIGGVRLVFCNEEGLKKFSDVTQKFQTPIGCRLHDDAVMYEHLGYESYVNGCITNTFPKRIGGAADYRKVYLIDVPNEAHSYMPKELLTDAVTLTQIMENFRDFPADQFYEICKERYRLLRDTARLVITIRYHVAVPCAAMGIPVIMLENGTGLEGFHWTFDARLPTLNPAIPFYTKDQWNEIDWNPAPCDFEDTKRLIVDRMISRIQNAMLIAKAQERTLDFFAPSKERFWNIFWQNRKRLDPFAEYLDRPFLSKIDGHFRYYLYGLSDRYLQTKRCVLVDYISKSFPDADFLGFVDKNKTGEFLGKPVFHPEQMKIDDSTYCLVSAYNANPHVERLFRERGYDMSRLWLMPKELVLHIYGIDPNNLNLYLQY